MEDIKSIIKKYIRRNYMSNVFYETIDDYYTVNQLSINELIFLKEYLKSLNKKDIFDDFLQLFFKRNLKNLDYDKVLDLLKTLDYGLNRRLIIILISLKIINYDNISSIDDKDAQIYFNILNGIDTFDYDVNKIPFYYRNIECHADNYYNYFYIQARQIPVLNEYDELKLLYDYKVNKKTEARDYLILSNLKIVMTNAAIIYNIKISNGYYGAEIDDLFTYGLFGLIRAIDHFDIYSGKKFSTYATSAIRQGIKRESLKDRSIVLPENLASKPDENTLNPDDKIKLENALKPMLSLYETYVKNGHSDSDDDLIVDFVSYEESLVKDNETSTDVADIAIDNIIKEKVDKIIDENIDERRKKVIRERYGMDDGIPRTLDEISQDLDITGERVRQLEVDAVKKLGKLDDIRELESYVKEDIIEIKEEVVEENKEEEEKEDIPKSRFEIKKERLEKLKKEVDRLLASYFGQDKLDVLNKYNSYNMLTNYLLENESIVDNACKSIGGKYGSKNNR